MQEIIREANINDLDDIMVLENECFIDPWKRKDWLYELSENPINKIIVLEKNLHVIGFIDYMITFNSATISQIAIKNEYRRQGLAVKLLNEMENTFPKDSEDIVETITLEVRASNEKAINLYLKQGYEKVISKPHYYSNGEDALYMIKRLI